MTDDASSLSTQSPLNVRLDIEGVDPDELVVLWFHGRESLSGGCAFDLLVVAQPQKRDAIFGKGCVLTLEDPEADRVRSFHLVVAEADLASTEEQCTLRLRLVSPFEVLDTGRNTRIFQEKTVLQVVSDVLDASRLRDQHGATACLAKYPVRPYIVQHRESDYDFMARILAEDGICFAVRQDDDKKVARLELYDSPGKWPALPHDISLFDRRETSFGHYVAYDLVEDLCRVPTALHLRDTDLRRGLTPNDAWPVAGDEGKDEKGHDEHYVFPGGFDEAADGKRLANVHLQRLQMRARTLRGQSDCFFLEPGRTFLIAGSLRESLSEEFLLVDVIHELEPSGEAATGTYRASFLAIPSATPYRPDVPATRIDVGDDRAFVSVPGGEEMHCDEYGRVKVRFPWDRSGAKGDKTSTWLRVGQVPSAGAMSIPRDSFEVLVGFEEGHPERPVILGRLYNEEVRPPFPLPEQSMVASWQTATTHGGPGANELRMDSTAGTEHLSMIASRDFTADVGNDQSFGVTNDETVTVKGNLSQRVTGKRTHNVTGNRTLEIVATQSVTVGGDVGDGIGGNLSTSVKAASQVRITGDFSETIHGKMTRHVAVLSSVTTLGARARKILKNSQTTVTGLWSDLIGKDRAVVVKGQFSEAVAALKRVAAKSLATNAGDVAIVAGAATLEIGGSRTDKAEDISVTAASYEVKAKTITLNADDQLTFKGGDCTIELKKSGEVHIKAPNIGIKGLKTLGQVMHKSNG